VGGSKKARKGGQSSVSFKLLKPHVLLVAIQCTHSPASQAFGDLLTKSELQDNRSELII